MLGLSELCKRNCVLSMKGLTTDSSKHQSMQKNDFCKNKYSCKNINNSGIEIIVVKTLNIQGYSVTPVMTVGNSSLYCRFAPEIHFINPDEFILWRNRDSFWIIWSFICTVYQIFLKCYQSFNIVLTRDEFKFPLVTRKVCVSLQPFIRNSPCVFPMLLFQRSKKTSKLCVTGLCAGNSPGTSEFPAQMASNAENVSIWWRHHAELRCHEVLTPFAKWHRFSR